MSAKFFRIPWVLALLAMTLPAFCQVTAPAYVSVGRVQVRADRSAEFQDLMKQTVEFYKKAAPADQLRLVYRVAVGNVLEYWTYTPMNKFADRDRESYLTTITKPEERAAKGPRVLQCVERIQASIEKPILTLTIVPNGAKFPPTFLRISRIRGRPGAANDFISLAKTTIVPAVKKINGTVLFVHQTARGGSPNDFFVGAGFEKWAELDDTATLVNAMGGEQALQKFQEKMAQVEADSEGYILACQPDMSYVPSGAAAPGR